MYIDLHNRQLYPPEPYINKIIFNDMLKEIKMMMEASDYDLESVAAINFDEKLALAKYFIRSLQHDESSQNYLHNLQHQVHQEISESVKKTILRSEKRKIISKISKVRVTEGIEHWYVSSRKRKRIQLRLFHFTFHA